jgi:hypothetical protein
MLQNVVHGRVNLYGYGVGILMIEGYFPRPPGAIGNATTFPFPVLHRVVKGATGTATVRALSTFAPGSDEYEAAVAPWIEGARDLEAQGVRAITTSCGFSALFQRELAASAEVPVFATSLLLVPFIARILKPGSLVGVVTADGRMLTPRHFEGAGVDPATTAVVGLEGCPHFEEMAYRDRHDIDLDRLEDEVVFVTRDLVRREPRVRAILLECSLLPPYAASIQREVRLPVFDFTHMIAMVHAAVVRQPFRGFL